MEGAGGMSLQSRSAVLPGQLFNDKEHDYNISRRYPAKPKQVNDIIKASETYADGGYGYYNRNCTTFVKNMVVDVAHLATGGEIFKEGEVTFSSVANLGLFGAGMLGKTVDINTDHIMKDLSKKDDLSYQGYGNKRVTREDYERYKKTRNYGSGPVQKTYIPAETGELMRRTEGDKAGELGSMQYSAGILNAEGNIEANFYTLNKKVDQHGDRIQEFLRETFGDEWYDMQLPQEIKGPINEFGFAASSLIDLDNDLKKYADAHKENYEEVDELKVLKPEDVRKARHEISQNVSTVSKILTKYFKNDARLHTPFMNFISLLNYCLKFLDELYDDMTLDKKK